MISRESPVLRCRGFRESDLQFGCQSILPLAERTYCVQDVIRLALSWRRIRSACVTQWHLPRIQRRGIDMIVVKASEFRIIRGQRLRSHGANEWMATCKPETGRDPYDPGCGTSFLTAEQKRLIRRYAQMKMLQHDSATMFRFVLQGELTADRVREFEHAWTAARSILGTRRWWSKFLESRMPMQQASSCCLACGRQGLS